MGIYGTDNVYRLLFLGEGKLVAVFVEGKKKLVFLSSVPGLWDFAALDFPTLVVLRCLSLMWQNVVLGGGRKNCLFVV